MSNIFDHALDAYESSLYDEGYSYDPLYYHMKIKFTEVIETTDKAYFVRLSSPSTSVWLPKSICRFFDEGQREVWVHRNTFYNILRETKAQSDREYG